MGRARVLNSDPLEDTRGGWWSNWSLSAWVEASHAYRGATPNPTDRELVGTWQVLLPEGGGTGVALQAHLAHLEEWAHTTDLELSAGAWQRAADVLIAGAIYE